MAACAASRREADEFADILRWESAIQDAAAAGRPAIEEDIGFHGAIARASGNRFFVLTLAALAEQTRFGIRLIRELSDRSLADRFAEVAREHAAISAAIGSGDADEARRAMTAHLKGGIRRLFGH
jgi:GntR family transcriptional repressor for pyruvate dehydrogenase complex